jgi:hypothetical protein
VTAPSSSASGTRQVQARPITGAGMSVVAQLELGHRPPAAATPAAPPGPLRVAPAACLAITAGTAQLRHPRLAALGDLDPLSRTASPITCHPPSRPPGPGNTPDRGRTHTGMHALLGTESIGDPLVGGIRVPIDAVGVDLQQDRDAAPGAAGDLGGRHPGVQPQRHRRVPQVVGAATRTRRG